MKKTFVASFTWLRIAKNVQENMIREQIKATQLYQGVQVQIKKGFFERSLLDLVEYPTAFMGSFGH